RILESLAASKLERLTVLRPNRATETKLVIGVEEVVVCVLGDAIKQVANGTQRGALAGFVRAVDEVQPLRARGEVERELRERTKRAEIELEDLQSTALDGRRR